MPKKCPICNQIIGADDPSVPYKNRIAHEVCFNNLYGALSKQRKQIEKDKIKKQKEEIEQKKINPPQIEISAPVSEEVYAEKKQYYDYLRELIPDLGAKHYAMTERMIKQYNFTFTGMYHTLKYLVEIEEKVLEGNIVGLIPYYYDDTQDYLQELDRIEQSNKGKDIKKMYQTDVVKISKRGQKRKKELDF